MRFFRKQIGNRTLLVPSIEWSPDLEQDAHLKMRRDRKKWLRQWGWTERGRDMLSDLIDRGYRLDLPHPIAGGGRNFDAVDDRIRRGADDATLDLVDTDSCAIQSLFKLDAISTVVRRIANKKGAIGAGAGYTLAMDATELLEFRVADGTDVVIVENATALVAGTWYAGTGVLNAVAAANDDLYLWKDATLAGPTNSILLGSPTNALNFTVGASSVATPTEFWDGDIAYARFWKKLAAAWTTQERLTYVELRDKLYLPQDLYMELQWILWDAGSPTTANDYTDNSFDGTYTGTTFVEDPKRVYKAAINPERVQRVFAAAALDPLTWQGEYPDRTDLLVPKMIPSGPIPGR